MVSLTVLVPAYNEEKTLEQSLNRLMELKIISQIIFVDDGSSDNTLKIANELAKKDPRLLILNQKTNYGKGKALITTKKHITSEYVVIHDADLEYSPIDLEEMLKYVNGSNLVLGSRFIGLKSRDNLYKRTYIANKSMSKFFSIVNKINVSDVATCYKMMPADFFIKTEFKENGFSIEIELISKFLKSSNDLIEVPISYSGRSYEEGKKIKTKDGFLYLFNILKYKFFN